MPAEWYIHAKDHQQGPCTWEQLWEKARSGQVQPGHQVWTEALSGWRRADEVPGLAHAPPAAEIPPPPPPIGLDAGSPTAASGAKGTQGLSLGGVSTYQLVAALAGAALLLTCSCGGVYLLLSRQGGLSAVLGGGGDPAAATRPIATPELVRGDEPTPTTESAPVSPTEPPGGDETDQPVVGEPREGVSPTDTPLEPPPTPQAPEETGLPSPSEVVDEFILSTLGRLPGSAIDHDRARALMTVAYAADFQSPEFVPLTYGIQDGPTSYEIFSEEIGDSTATVLVLAYWGDDIGHTWRFDLEHEAGLWRVSDIQIGEQGSAFWELYPMVEAFSVYDQGGWKLEVTFQPPAQEIEADFRVEYRREDDGSLAFSQEASGVIEPGDDQMTLDSDWSEYKLSQMGFEPGGHRAAAMIDGAVIAVGQMTVE